MKSYIHREEQVFGKELAPLYADIYHTRYYQTLRRLVSRQAKQLCRGRSTPRVLDLGCGPCSLVPQLLAEIPDARVVGADVSLAMLIAGRQAQPTVGVCNAVVEELPFRSESFDLVIGFSVLHHLPDLAGTWSEIARVLRPGGAFVFGEPRKTLFDRWPWLVKVVKLLFGPLYLPLWMKNHSRPRPAIEQRLGSLVTEVHRSLTTEELFSSARLMPLAIHQKTVAVIAPLFLPMMFDDGWLEQNILELLRWCDILLAPLCQPLASEIIVFGRRL